MSRQKTRVPGRYERPAEFRPALGDRAGELGVRAGYREGVRVRAQNARAQRRAADLAGDLIRSGRVTVVDEPPAAGIEVATVENAGVAAVAKRGALPLRESVGGRVAEAPKDTASGRLVTIDVIRSGWNTSGSRYYGAAMLERDVPKVYGRGTQMYIDHPSATEGDDRPERSLQTLAGVFVDDPWAVREADGTVVMRTTARVFGPWQPLIREAWDTIGVSINGNGRGDYGTAEGREGLIIDELTYGRSVDFVTVPGAGGRVLGLLESDRPADAGELATREAGSLGAYVESRIHLGFTEIGDQLYAGGYVNRAERITLSGAIGDALGVFVARLEADAPQLYQRTRYDGPAEDTVTAEAAAVRTREATVEQYRAEIDRALSSLYAGNGRYCWVQDFDPDHGIVWFTAGSTGNEPSKTYQQGYITSGGRVHLTGERVEVRARTVYEPVTSDTAEAGRPRAVAPGGLVDLDALARYAAARTTETTSPAGAGEVSTTESKTAGDPPAATDDGPNAPEITTEEGAMPEKNADVVAREAAELRATTAETKLARYEAADAARPVIDALLAEAGDLSDLTKTRVRESFPAADLPLTADNKLDEPALRESVGKVITKEKDYAAQLLEAAGAGTVRNNGAPAGAGTGAPTGIFGATRTTEAATSGDGTGDGDVPADTREALIKQFMAGGNVTREAAEAAIDGR
jgi:hypothetical protein